MDKTVTLAEFRKLNQDEYLVFDEETEQWVNFSESCYIREEGGFPDVFNPDEEVLLITCQDIKTKALTTFGCLPYSGSDTNYILCKDEPDLLSKFINFIIDVDPDIITGWNVIRFDVAYLFSRIIKILGQRALNRISPFGIVDRKIDTVMDQELLRYDIIGRVVLDLLELYKKFRFKTQPNYKLGYIGQDEIGETKLKSKYPSFKASYSGEYDDTVDGDILGKNRLKLKRELIRRGLKF